MAKSFLVVACLSGAMAVMLGAFGAHALKQQLAGASSDTYQTAVFYHFIHTLVILSVGIWLKLQPENALLPWAGVMHIGGVLFFCGSLYYLALGGPRWLGPITPLGGLSFIVGWVLMAMAALK